LKGVQVLESFDPSAKGAKVVDFASDPIKGANKITTTDGKQSAVTFGAGVTTQELNNALDPSGLFTMGAAHGEVGVAGGWVGSISNFTTTKLIIQFRAKQVDMVHLLASLAWAWIKFWSIR
jgi:hypothetical protein